MTARYTEKQIEDVTRILRHERDAGISGLGSNIGSTAIACVMLEFANLFTADNPTCCTHCGQPANTPYVFCFSWYDGHNWRGGFNREQFLAACGLDGPWNEAVEGLANAIDNLRARK